MNLRTMVGAFLSYKEEMLLIHRGTHKEIAPGMWSCIGGHMESEELNNPLAACYREILEETGIGRGQIEYLTLRYITTRNTGSEIRTGYYYYGETTHRCELPKCDEGKLHWVRIMDMQEMPMSFSIKEISNHLVRNRTHDVIMLCGVNRTNNIITWVEL